MLIPQPSGRDGGPTSQRKRCRATSHKSARAFFNLQSRKDNLGPTWAGSLSQERQTPSQPILTAEVSRPPLLRAPTPLHTTLFLQTGPHRGLSKEELGPPCTQNRMSHRVRGDIHSPLTL
uniref:Uncharacterized protein n=1 Tax=Knipowitschia caucasica TaxID=637954 RepID=A0AAV2LVU1_KNICA